MLSLVLSRQNFKEHDQIISLYTLNRGKTEVLAKGVKKIVSKNASFLEPFCFIDAEVVSGKQMDRLTRVQIINSFKNIREDLYKIKSAGYIAKFLDKVLHPGAPDEDVFNLLLSWGEFANGSNGYSHHITDAFFVKLYKILGLDITQNGNPDPILELFINESWDNIYNLKPSEGEVVHQNILSFIGYHAEMPVKDWAEELRFSCQF